MKFILYIIVLSVSAALGFVASFMLARPAPDLAQPVSMTERAAESVAAATSSGVDFTMPNMLGGESSLSDWSGQPRLINFWATWCAPCRREIPLLKSLQDAQRPAGLQVIGIAFDEMAAVNEYAVDTEFNYPVLVGEQQAVAAAEAFDIELMALPFTLVVSAEGELINVHVGEIDADEAEQIIAVMSELQSGGIGPDEARSRLAAQKTTSSD